MLLEWVPEIHVFLRYLGLRAMLVHHRPGFCLYETHMTPIPVGSARVRHPDDMIPSDIVKTLVAEPQGWDPKGGAR